MPRNPEDLPVHVLEALVNYDPGSFMDTVGDTIGHLNDARAELASLRDDLARKSNPEQALWIATVSGLLIGLEHHTAAVNQAFIDKMVEFSQGRLRVQPAKEETNELPEA